MVHVAFLYGVCVGNTARIVDQMFGKVKPVVVKLGQLQGLFSPG